jgi:hypothetical protein
VLACGGPLKDSAGCEVCLSCTRRLSNRKGKPRRSGAGHICQSCFDKQRRGVHRPAEAAPTSSPHRSHKRRAQSDRGEFRTALAAATAPPSPVACSLFAHSRWATHQCRISAGSRRTRTLALSWLALLSSGELLDWEEKRGGFWQHVTHKQLHCSYEDDRRVKLLAATGSLGRALLAELGIDSSEAALQLGDVKLLRSSFGQGEQEIHYDIVQYDLARQCYTILLYLTPTLSTALPKLPLAELRGTFSDGEQPLPADELAKLQRDQFVSTRVESGDALVLNCAVPHWGVNNPDTADRFVVFASFSPRSKPAPDTEQQRYPHGVKD